MDLKQFYYFLAIAEECSLTRAAGRLFLSQPALSRFLAKLEETLHTTLFIREKNNSLIITESGLLLKDYCQKVISDYEDLVRQYSEYYNESIQHLTFGITGERNMQILARCLPAFVKKHPTISIEIVQRPANDLVDLVLTRTVDLARCAFIDSNPKLEFLQLSELPIDIVLPQDHPLAKLGEETASDEMGAVPLEAFRNDTFVLLKEDTVLRKIIDGRFSLEEFRPRVSIEVTTSQAAFSVIESGVAVGLLPRSYHSDRVRFLRLESPLLYRSGIIWRKGKHISPVEKDLIRLFQLELSGSQK